MNKLSDDLRKIFLAGIGAVASTAEKSKEIIDNLVTKGELTLEQGKALNEELKRNVNQTFHESSQNFKENDLSNKLKEMSPEEIKILKEKLAEMENQDNAENS